MKVVMKILFATMVLTVGSSTASTLPKNETAARFVFTYDVPGNGFFDHLPENQSIDNVLDYVANTLNVTWSKIKNYEIPGLNIHVSEMTPILAQKVSQLPFVKTMERDVQIQVEKPLNNRIQPLSGEEAPYGISMVGALDVSDDLVGNRVVCIIDSGYDINHPDLPTSASGLDTTAGPWYQDGDGHVSLFCSLIITFVGSIQSF